MSIYAVSSDKTVAYNKVYLIENGKTKKLGKGYVIENSKTKKIYSGDPFGGYTGTYTTSEVTKDGVLYTLYTMTGSGTLTLNEEVEYWMCGGGAGGRRGQGYGDHFQTVKDFLGVGGGGGYVKSGTLSSGSHVITIGAGGNSTLDSDKDGSATAVKSESTVTADGGFCNGDGASGGGAGVSAQITTADGDEVYDNAVDGRYHGDPGTGAGVSTYPFGLTTLKAHSAGGGSGGSFYYKNKECHRQKGNAGGTNGSDGKATTSRETGVSNTTYADGGNGGTYGGGKGGRGQNSNGGAQAGTAATFYGSGGGGGGSRIAYGTYSNTAGTYGSGGAGYQGVFYLLIPA